MTHHHHIDGAGVWAPCGTCWGQRRVWSAGPGGALRPAACPSCLGVGERLQDGGHVPAPASS